MGDFGFGILRTRHNHRCAREDYSALARLALRVVVA
jgi:hypothetical protein